MTRNNAPSPEVSEETDHWKLALESLGIGTLQIDSEMGSVRRSLRHDQIYGYSELEPSRSFEFFMQHVASPDRLRVERACEDALSTRGDLAIEYRIHRTDGEQRCIAMRGKVRNGRNGSTCLWATIEDITERRVSEQRLRESNIKFQRLAEAMPQLVWIADSRGVVEYCNSLGSSYSAFRQSASSGNKWRPLIHADDFVQTRLDWETAVARSSSYVCEHRIGMANGEFRWHLSRAVPVQDERGTVQWYGTSTDIHEFVEANSALRDKDFLLQVASRAARLGGWAVDLTRSRVEWCDEVCAIFDVPAGTSPTIDEAIHAFAPEERARIRTLFDACVCDGAKFDETLQILTPRNRRIWVRVLGEPVFNRAGDIAGARGAIQDIHERKQIELEARRLAERFTSMLESMTDAVFTVDRAWRFTYINSESEQLLGRSRDELLGKVIWDELEHVRQARFATELQRATSESTAIRFEAYVESLSAWLDVRAYPSDDGLTVHYRDITDRKEIDARMEYLSFFDPLTGLPNWRLLQDRAEICIAHAHQDDSAVAVFLLDIDRFKHINDALGRKRGDEVLRCVAERLRSLVADTDTIARHDGDDFAILMSAPGAWDASKVAVDILEAVREPLEIDGHSLYVSLSVGVATYPLDGTDFASLMRNADLALRGAKKRGRNTFECYSQQMNTGADILTLQTALHQALTRKEFELHYQPLVNLSSGKITGVEALIRWRSPDLGFVAPSEFIPLAEDTGLILPIGNWVLEEALREMSRLCELGYGHIRMAVNLSARQFRQKNLVTIIATMLDKAKLNPNLLKIEITETMMMDRVEETIACLEEFRKLGVSVALDDFGTGYSSLKYLKDFHIDYLKVDKSFVDGIPGSAGDVVITQTIIAMARSLNICVIAEGVETQEQLRTLRELDCDEAQGYLFSPPLPAESLRSMLKQASVLPATNDTLPADG